MGSADAEGRVDQQSSSRKSIVSNAHTQQTAASKSATTMPTGSCLCGEIKVEYTGEPTYTAC